MSISLGGLSERLKCLVTLLGFWSKHKSNPPKQDCVGIWFRIPLIKSSHKWTRMLFIISNSKLGIWICSQPRIDLNSQSNFYDVLTRPYKYLSNTLSTLYTKQHALKTIYMLVSPDCMQTYIFLIIDNSVCQLAQIPAYFYFLWIDTMVIIMNNLHYIYEYEKLKYGIFIASLLSATC